MAKKILTLNIGASTVELAEYEAGSRGALTLVNYGTAALAAPLDGGNAEAILSPALLEIVRERGIKPGPVAISVPGQTVFPRFAAIPATGGEEKFEQMVRYEIEQNIPFPIDEMVCDRQVVGETEAGDKSVLIVAAKVDQVEAITSAVSAAGFTPEVVDAAPLALTNALRSIRPDDSCVILLDIGSRTTSLVLAEGGRIYNRSIPVAGAAITKEIAAALGCSTEEAEAIKLERGYVALGGVTEDEDEVVNRVSKACRAVLTRLNAEISRSVNFYRSQQGGGRPEKLYLTGGGALLPQVDVFFSEMLGIEVEFFNPFEQVGVGPKVDAEALASDGALIAPTVGLALHQMGLAQFAINLLPPSIVAARAEKAKIPFVIGGGLAFVAALVLVTMAVNQQAEKVEEARDAMQSRASKLSREDQQVQKAATDLAAAEAEAQSLRRLYESRSASLRRLTAVYRALEGRPGMWIDRWDASGVAIRYWTDLVKGDSSKTAEESVVGAIASNDTNVIDRASVKITSMSEIGSAKAQAKQLKQFTVEFKKK